MGRLGQIGSSQTPCQILNLGGGPLLKYPLPKQNMKENIFGGHFPSEHNGVTNFKL